VCSRRVRLLRRFLRELDRRTSYTRREIVVVEHRYAASAENAARDALLKGVRCLRVPYDAPFNFSRMNNLGVEAASGEILMFLNDDTEPLRPDWLERMVAQALRGEVGAVGAKLVYPNGTIQHAGLAIGIGDVAGHPGRNQRRTPFWNWADCTRNVTAVTGACLAVRREVFAELGGFDTAFAVNYNDVDFCLRARRAGYEVIYDASAVLQHREAQTRLALVLYDERERFYQRWGEALAAGDPYYSPNLNHRKDDAWLRLETSISAATLPFQLR